MTQETLIETHKLGINSFRPLHTDISTPEGVHSGLDITCLRLTELGWPTVAAIHLGADS